MKKNPHPLERVLEYYINEDFDKAQKLFHEYIVEVARKKYEELLNENDPMVDSDDDEEDFDTMEEDDELDLSDEGIEEEDVEEEDVEDEVESEIEREKADLDLEDRLADVEQELAQLRDEFEQLEKEEDEEEDHDEDEDHDHDDEDDEDHDHEEEEDDEEDDLDHDESEEDDEESDDNDDEDHEDEEEDEDDSLKEGADDYLSAVKGEYKSDRFVGSASEKPNINKMSPFSAMSKSRRFLDDKHVMTSKFTPHEGFDLESPPEFKDMGGKYQNTHRKIKLSNVDKSMYKNAKLVSKEGFEE